MQKRFLWISDKNEQVVVNPFVIFYIKQKENYLEVKLKEGTLLIFEYDTVEEAKRNFGRLENLLKPPYTVSGKEDETSK